MFGKKKLSLEDSKNEVEFVIQACIMAGHISDSLDFFRVIQKDYNKHKAIFAEAELDIDKYALEYQQKFIEENPDKIPSYAK